VEPGLGSRRIAREAPGKAALGKTRFLPEFWPKIRCLVYSTLALAWFSSAGGSARKGENEGQKELIGRGVGVAGNRAAFGRANQEVSNESL
jgi:hypothetical protein